MAVRQIRADGLGDFTTLAAWHASLPSPLIEDEIAVIYGTVDASGTPTIFSVVTSPTARLIIRAASGQETSYLSGDGKARIDFGAFDFRIASNSSRHVTFENIAIYLGVGASGAGIFMDSSGAPPGADWQWRNCFIARGGSNFSTGLSRPFPGLVIENTVIFNLRGASNTGIIARNVSFIAGFAPVDLGGVTADKGIFERCYFANNTNSLGQLFSEDGGSFDLAFSDDNSGRVTPDIAFAALADQYTDPANGDWSFKAGNALAGAGTGGLDIGFVLPGGGGGEPPAGIVGAGAATMGAMVAGVAGALRISGTGAIAMTPPVGMSQGHIRISGSADAMLRALSAASEGGLTINGIGAAMLPSLLAAGAAGGIAGVAAIMLSAMAAHGAGSIMISGQGAVALAAQQAAASGGVRLSGDAIAVLRAFGLAAAGAVSVTGSGAALLPGLEAAASARLRIDGAIAAVMAALEAFGGEPVSIDISASPRRTIVIRAGERTIVIEAADRRLPIHDQGRTVHV